MRGITVRLVRTKAQELGTARDRIERDIEITGPLDAAQRDRLRDIADRCPVHRVLAPQIDIVTRFTGDGP